MSSPPLRRDLDALALAAVDEQAIAVALLSPDDRLLWRSGVLLQREGVVAHVEASASLDVGLGALQRHPSVAVLGDPRDLSTASVAAVRRALPGVPLVAVLPAHRDAEATVLVQAGVAGIVLESSFDETFALVVRSVVAGLMVVPRKLRRATTAATLTPREREILALVAVGLTNEEIAGRLFLSESTVKGHLTTAFRRLGVRSRAEAAALTAELAVATPEGER